jgi:AcrR family transcriptional regulator
MARVQTPGVVRGRQLQAARNDRLILDAARKVFIANPAAPIGSVATEAGVGIAALYRRYRSKDDLLRTLCAEGQATYIGETQQALSALADGGEPGAIFTGWMSRIVEADTLSLVERLVGTFTPTEQMFRDGTRIDKLNKELFDRVRAAGAVRADVNVSDVVMLFEMVAAVRVSDPQRTRQLRSRYLALLVEALRPATPGPLPWPPPTARELEQRWHV